MTSKLPDKPSTLIRLALADLRKCEASKGYVIEMNDWHTTRGRKCEVCLAGAVMAQSLGADIDLDMTPGSFGDVDTATKLSALDEFRQGNIWAGLGRMGIEAPDDLYEEQVPEYSDGRAAFHRAMLMVSDILEEEDL